MINLARNFVLCVFLSSIPSVFCVPPALPELIDSVRIQCILKGGVEPTLRHAFYPPPTIPKSYTHIEGIGVPAYHVRTSYSSSSQQPSSSSQQESSYSSDK